MNPAIVYIVFILILLHVYFIIPFMILMIMMPKIKKATKSSKRTYSPFNQTATEALYFVEMPRQDIIEILSVHDLKSDFNPTSMQLILRDSSYESLYRIVIEEIEGGCIVKALVIEKSYRNTSHGKLNSFFKEHLGAKGYSYEKYHGKDFDLPY